MYIIIYYEFSIFVGSEVRISILVIIINADNVKY